MELECSQAVIWLPANGENISLLKETWPLQTWPFWTTFSDIFLFMARLHCYGGYSMSVTVVGSTCVNSVSEPSERSELGPSFHSQGL